MNREPNRRVPFFRHDLGAPELAQVAEVLKGEILTTGEYVGQFERKLADYLGRKHVLAVSSCTGALHLSMLGLGIGPGDEVITTPMTFIATATAILEAGATPVFVDVEPETGNLNADLVEAAITPRTRAIMPVHLYGLMCDMRALRSIADRHGLKIIEDSAHCVEAKRDGVGPGELGDTACFSFYATKNLTCGEGGALATDNTQLYDRLKLLHLHGMTKTAFDRSREGYKHWDMVVLGWKYNMSNIEAALLLPQFDRIEAKLEQRTALARRYDERLAAVPGVRRPGTLPNTIHSRHVYAVRVAGEKRDDVIELLKAEQIGCVVNYRAVHLMQYFREHYGHKPGDFPVAERMGDETISLPFYPGMALSDVDIVADALERALTRNFVQAS
ncbi:MAG: DegT/DnrJ/EryC1/StrS family aminotransferase [Xanthobacteraceae bacterium]